MNTKFGGFDRKLALCNVNVNEQGTYNYIYTVYIGMLTLPLYFVSLSLYPKNPSGSPSESAFEAPNFTLAISGECIQRGLRLPQTVSAVDPLAVVSENSMKSHQKNRERHALQCMNI